MFKPFDHSLPKSCRLHKSSEFSTIIDSGYQISGSLIQIYMKPNELGYARLGLIVSKRIERYAVGRNWVKRILREIFRKGRSAGDQTRHMDWVIRLKRPVDRSESAKLITEVQLLMTQIQQCHA